MPFLNGALPLAEERPPGVEEAEVWFASRGSQPVFRLQVGVHDDLIEQLLASGYIVSREEPVLSIGSPDAPEYEGPLEIVPVRNNDELSAMLERIGKDSNFSEFDIEMSRTTAAMPNAAELWGLIGNTLVAGSIVVSTPTVAGIYAVSCEPNFRRRGFGTAVTWAAATEGLVMGAESVFMGSTTMALPVYMKMGFEPVCKYLMLTRPNPAT